MIISEQQPLIFGPVMLYSNVKNPYTSNLQPVSIRSELAGSSVYSIVVKAIKRVPFGSQKGRTVVVTFNFAVVVGVVVVVSLSRTASVIIIGRCFLTVFLAVCCVCVVCVLCCVCCVCCVSCVYVYAAIKRGPHI